MVVLGRIFPLVVFTFCCFATIAQPFFTHFEYLDSKNGLPQNHVFSISQDEYGFIWFCTMGGLSKYNGFNFENYIHNPLDSTSISSSFTDRFLQDSKNRFWVTTNNGLNQLNRKTGKFIRYLHDPSDTDSPGDNTIKDIKEDAVGQLWFVHNKGVDRFDPDRGEFTHYFHEDFSVNRYAGDICIDDRGTIWVLGVNGLYKVNQKEIKLDFVATPDFPSDIVVEGRHIMQDSRGTLWVAFNRGLMYFDYENQSLKPAPNIHSRTNVSTLVEYPKGVLAIGTFGYGMLVYSLYQQKVINIFNYKSSNPLGIANSTIYSFFVDKSSNLWIGLFNGINRINTNAQRFGLIQNETGINNLKNYTLLVYGDKNDGIWANTMEGLFYRKNVYADYISVLNPPNFAVGHHDVRGIAELNEEITLINIRANGLYAYHKNTNQLRRIGSNSFLKDDYISYILLDKSDTTYLYLLGKFGLGRINLNALELNWLSKDSLSLIGKFPAVFHADISEEGVIYFVAEKVLYAFDTKSNEFRTNNLGHQFPSRVNAIHYYKKNLWIASENGIYTLNLSTQKQDEILDENQLSVKSLGLQIDTSGVLWSVANDVVTKIDLAKNQIVKYKSPTGFVIGIGHTTHSGDILFGGPNGILYINPYKYFRDTLKPFIIFNGIEILNKKVKLPIENEFSDHIELNYDDKVFTLHYAALHFINRENIKYRYQLEGFDKTWVDAGVRRNATYTNLDPGSYIFRAEAITEDGMPSQNKLMIIINIKAPFYKSPIFYALVVIMIGSVIYTLIALRNKARLATQQKELAEKNALYKDMFLSNVSHEIRTPMNSIIGLNKLLLDTPLNETQKKYLDAVLTSGENLLWIVNDILDQAKIESGKYKIVNEPFSIIQLINKIETLFRFKAEDKGLEFIIQVDPNLPDILSGDRVRIFQILNNLLNNAIKFTDEGYILLRVESNRGVENRHDVTFLVEDTGIGIPSEKLNDVFDSFYQLYEKVIPGNQGVGLGLSIVKNLVKLLGGKIAVNSKEKLGTSISFTLVMTEGQMTETDQYEANIILPTPLNILLVEDTPFNQLLAIELLKKHAPHAGVDIAENGQVAIDKINSNTYHLVLMDVKMPVMSGIDATKIIRSTEDEKIKNIPILGLTASAIPQQIELCLTAGMNDVITKPINEIELVQKISKIFADG